MIAQIGPLRLSVNLAHLAFILVDSSRDMATAVALWGINLHAS